MCLYIFCLHILLKLLFYSILAIVVGLIGFKLWFNPFSTLCKCTGKLHGKIAIVTGGNSGIGLETARDFAKRGARVIIASRDEKKSQEAVADIIATTGNSKVEYIHLDLSKFSSIRKFSEEFNKNYERLDILVNNAGVAGLRQTFTEDNVEVIMQVNYIGPFLLTSLLLPKLMSSTPSRVVIVSSFHHHLHKLDVDDLIGKKPLDYSTRYGNSKVCNILWAKALAKRLPDGVTVNALEPGLIKTNIFQRLPKYRRKITLLVIGLLFKTPKEGAQTIIHVSIAPKLDGVSGKYFSECKLCDKTSEITNNDDIIEKLWDKTMMLTQTNANGERLVQR